jgi:hypothetical protein
MSQVQPATAKTVALNGVRRAVPVAAAAGAGFQTLFVDRNYPIYSYGLFYNGVFRPFAVIAMVTLPVLAWALLAPTAQLALPVGLVFVAGVAEWSLWVARANAAYPPVDNRDLHRAYPLIAGAAVMLALIISYTYGRRRWPNFSRLGSAGMFWQLWAAFRIVAGSVALIAGMALHFIWAQPVGPVPALLAG